MGGVFQKQFTSARLDDKVKNGVPRKQVSKKDNKKPPKNNGKGNKKRPREVDEESTGEKEDAEEVATEPLEPKKKVVRPRKEACSNKKNVSVF